MTVNRKLQRGRTFLNSLWGRLLISHVAIALASLTIAGIAVVSGILPIYNALTYTRMEDSLLLAYSATQDSPRSFGPRQGNPNNPNPPDSSQDLLRQRFNAVVQRQLESQNLRMLLVELDTNKVTFDSAGEWVERTLRFRVQSQPPRSFDGAPPVIRTGRSEILRSRMRMDGRVWLYVSVQVDRASADPPTAIVLLARATTLGDAGRYMQAILPGPLMLVILSALFVTIWLLSAGFTRSLTRNLRPVITGTQEIAAGNLAYRVADDASSLAEVQSLGQSFNRMAEEVQASRQAQRDFVANVGHDLKTPLTSIQGFTQALLDGTATTPQAQERAASIIHDESQRLGRLVDELLDVARLEGDRLHLQRQPLDLADFLGQMVDRHLPQAQSAGVDLGLDLAALVVPAQLYADPDRLQRVFGNLLDNALAHTPEQGTVTVSAQPISAQDGTPWVEIAVTDTGRGIPPEDLAHIFERFYRVDKSRTGRQGSGLGLAIVRELVQAHGGTVRAESVLGQGSRFRVRLPLSTA